MPNGCVSRLSTAPVWTLLLKQISSGIRLSSTYCARSPIFAILVGSCESRAMSSMSRVACQMRCAPLDCLPDAFLAERFAGVNGDVEVGALDVVERVDVLLGRKPSFLAREV